MGRELPSSPTKVLFTGYRFPTLSYTSSSQITILPYTWSLKKVPLSGGASPYRPLSGKYPPGLEATALTFKVQQSLSFRLSYGLQTEMISFLRYLFPGGIQDFKWRGSVIEWKQIQNPRIPQGFQQNPKKYLDQKLTPKNAMPNFRASLSVFIRKLASLPWYITVITITNLQIVLNTRKNPYYKSSHPKKILAKFSYPPKIPESKLSNPQNPPIIPVTWNPKYTPPPRLICLYKA